MMGAERFGVELFSTSLAVLFLVALTALPDLVRGDTEPPTAWTEDPPQMTTDKVLSSEKKDENYAQAKGITPPEGEEERVKKPSVLENSSRRFVGQLTTAGNSGRLESSQDKGIPPPGQQEINVEMDKSLKFLPAHDLKAQVLTKQMDVQQKEILVTSQQSSSRTKTTARDNKEADPVVPPDSSKENAATKTSLAGSSILSGSKTVLSALGVNVPNILPDTSAVRIEEIPAGDFIQNMLQEAEHVLNGVNVIGDPFLDVVERHRADLARGVIPIIGPIDDPGTSSGFLLRALGLKHLLPSSYAAGFTNDEPRELSRLKRDFSKAVPVKANETQVVLSRNVSTKGNDTLVQDKHPTPGEQLKISRIGYIIFEKDGKIKEAKEASVSELAKAESRTEKPLQNHRKKLIHACRHGNFIHPTGLPAHNAQRLGANVEAGGAGKQVEIQVPGWIPRSDGKEAFPGENEKAFNPNSIEVLTIREDIAKGVPKKDLHDWYEVQGNGITSKVHHPSSVLSSFHVLLITATCILTFVTILYLSSKIRSDNGGPRRLNSHTALFEPRTKYERY